MAPMNREPTSSSGLQLTSSAFQPGQAIPTAHTCDGADRSPPLSWHGLPGGTRALALIVDDPDAPGGVFTHWVYFDLPVGTAGLPAGVPTTARPEPGGIQGRNDFGTIGYRGPCPPRGPAHHYRFKLYALDEPVALPPGASKDELLQAMQGHVLGQTELVGTYERRG
jgi:Raf kinase inhibitor-like YbhB/YbcL family protein